MDEPYLLATARYVEWNPVRAKLVADVADWPWSSATAHLAGHNDRLANVAPMLAMVHDWRAFLHSAIREEELRHLRAHGRTGRPLGHADFVDRLERLVGRTLGPKKPGRKPKLLKQPLSVLCLNSAPTTRRIYAHRVFRVVPPVRWNDSSNLREA